jgi:predicted lipoprotein with Yx(FWY)xxD motif
MLKRYLVLLPLLLALVFAGASAQDEPTVETTDDPELGTYLIDAEGMTLYLFTKDVPGSGVSVCNDQCAENWPPFTAEDPLTLPEGVPGELTEITRDDGTQQVAYNGQPLYYYVKDMEPGDTTGQDVGEVWYVVSPGELGATPAASPGATPMATPATPTM